MLCPTCKVELRITERQNVEIDYCPQCRGVWLDRGELDKIIDRVSSADANRAPDTGPNPLPRHADPSRGKPDDSKYGMPYHGKRKSILRELFDF